MIETLGAPDAAPQDELRSRLLEAALVNVAFDGWSDATFRAACRDAEVESGVARVLFPRGGVDLALAYHEQGDRLMMERLALEDLPTLRLRERIARAIRYRIEAIDDKEAVRRGTALLSLPQYATDSARALWTTADRIWAALGDSDDDINWYTKRASLAGVYASTVLYWLGDESDGNKDTWSFLDRRVADVMRLEEARARITGNPVLKRVFVVPNRLLAMVRAPQSEESAPGQWAEPPTTPGAAFRHR
ncbi:COQ9 family protein [Tropicimonas marinistellae]|uniref:COQ9 family protein n=1 Tax=Tropicimonas marinistellae TaxID=1739787 RepID=UPI0008333E44|nr:COQ9 family protein [Tropicimonas marinistellae]